jgi:hypothetical protein
MFANWSHTKQSITRGCAASFTALLLLCLPQHSLAQSWVGSPYGGPDEGTVYRTSDDAKLPIIRVITMKEIAGACSCDVSSAGGETVSEQIEFGLSTLWIDAYDLANTQQNGATHLYGEAETENGSRNILAGFKGDGPKAELHVYLDEPDAFNLEAAKSSLASFEANDGPPKAAAAKPKDAPSSGAALLAGVKRDLEAASQTRKATPAQSKPRSSSTRSGSELLAGIKRDVEGPAKARAEQRAKAQA